MDLHNPEGRKLNKNFSVLLAAGLAVIVCGADVRPDNHRVKGQLRNPLLGKKQKPK